jgi:hypothetical protein
MRLLRAACVCAVAIVSPMSLATSASAFQHPSPNGHCRVSLLAPRPWQITAGEPIKVGGQLVCHRTPGSAGQTVRLYQHIPGTPGVSIVQTTTTNQQGEYEFQVTGVETDRVYFVRSRGARSENRGVRVAARVTLVGPPEGTQLLTGRGNEVTFSGTVVPADENAHVVLQRQSATGADEWHAIGFGLLAGGRFTIAHRFLVPGDADLRVLVRSRADENAPSPSNVLTYEISQAQNPALTISANTDPIVYSQSVTISGKLEGGASQPVALLAHTVGAHGQRGYSQVAQATTNEHGEYTFAAQSPVNSTYYRVKGAGRVSAVLYEGVRYLLSSVSVSSTTVREGQVLTFSGSVAPAPSRPEHPIYIERQGIGGEFHVVHVGYLNAESKFSIPYQPFSAGDLVFRVRVTGGPANGSALSQQFAITVTPVPLEQLAAEAPGNTSLPTRGSEGGEGSPRADEGQEAPPAAEGVTSEGSAPAEGGSEGGAPGGGHHRHPHPHPAH